MLNKLLLNELRIKCTSFPSYKPSNMYAGGGWEKMRFPCWQFCGWPNSRAMSPEFAPLLQVSVGNSQMSSGGTRAGKRAIGNSVPWRVASRRAEWMSYLSFPSCISLGTQCWLELSLCVGRTILCGPLSQLDWELESGAEYFAFCSLFVGFYACHW